MGGVVAGEGADAIAIQERPDVAADLVDVFRLVVGDDVQEHGLEADNGGVFRLFPLVLDPDGDGRWPDVSQHGGAEVGHVVGGDAAARLEKRVFVPEDVELPFAEAEAVLHEAEVG